MLSTITTPIPTARVPEAGAEQRGAPGTHWSCLWEAKREPEEQRKSNPLLAEPQGEQSGAELAGDGGRGVRATRRLSEAPAKERVGSKQ